MFRGMIHEVKTTACPAPPVHMHFYDLPAEVISKIFSYLPWETLVNSLPFVSTKMYSLTKTFVETGVCESIKHLDMRNPGIKSDS